jgi:hypothetical protein
MKESRTTKITKILSIGMVCTLSACAMPTEPEGIAGVPVSTLKYKRNTCEELNAEITALYRRQTLLNLAQQKRIESSQVQAFWWGFGQGDGIEAFELAQNKGESEAIRNVMLEKDCGSIPEAPKPIKPPVSQNDEPY